jgi:hypothetical protein
MKYAILVLFPIVGLRTAWLTFPYDMTDHFINWGAVWFFIPALISIIGGVYLILTDPKSNLVIKIITWSAFLISLAFAGYVYWFESTFIMQF